MPCHAMPCNAMPCIATQYNVMCNAMQARSSNAMSCHALPCNVMQCHAMPCNTMQCHAMPCNIMPCYDMHCHAMPCNAMPCIAMPCNVLIEISLHSCAPLLLSNSDHYPKPHQLHLTTPLPAITMSSQYSLTLRMFFHCANRYYWYAAMPA